MGQGRIFEGDIIEIESILRFEPLSQKQELLNCKCHNNIELLFHHYVWEIIAT